MALDMVQEQEFLVDSRQSFNQSFLRIIMTLQDSQLEFTSTTQSVQYNMVTYKLISGAQLAQINQAILAETGNKISFKKSQFHVRPVHVKKRLGVRDLNSFG